MATRATKKASKAKPAGSGSSKRYGDKASEKVERALHEMKRGELHSGGSGRLVTNKKQAIAIGLSEARREGGKVPTEPRSKTKARSSTKTRTKSKTRTRARAA